MRLKKARALCLLAICLGVFTIFTGNKTAKAASEQTICDGVTIDKINVSGMTREEATKAVDTYVMGLSEKEIAVVLDEEVAITSIKDLGYSCNENSYIDEALNLGKIGNLIKRYKEIKDVKNVGKNYELDFKLDDAIVRDFIAAQCSVYDIAAKNADVQRVNGQFVYSEEVTGRKLDVDATYQTITNAILNDWNQLDLVVDATINDDIPKYNLELVQKCNTLLGTYNTNYATSNTERKNNVANAARLINNSVVYPGEVFSCYAKMNPFTSENGYYSAGIYVNGMVEESIGGGVCQVSSTLYNAVLKAELEITERAPHSMTVSYVPVSFDAAIAGTYKDFKFKNNGSVPVLIEAKTNGSTITFNVYGCETRDTVKRKIEFKSEIISKTEPPKDVITEDPTQPTTYQKVTQGAHTGYVAVLYKYVYENGVLVDTIQVNKSSYKATPAYITVGTKTVEEEKPEAGGNNVADQDQPDDNNQEKPQKPQQKPQTEQKPQTDSKPQQPQKPENQPENNETDVEADENQTNDSTQGNGESDVTDDVQ